MDEPYFDRLAILGLGLIGGSFALAAREYRLAREIVAYDPDVQGTANAIALGVIEQGFSSPSLAVDGADGIILAAPVRAIQQLLTEIAPSLMEGAFLMDLGSTKQAIVSAMDDILPTHLSAVGGHPMAGKESSGLGAAEATLFQGATFALCATARTDGIGRDLAERIVTAIGAQPLWVEATAHDAAVARVSQLPYVLAAVLAHAASPEGLARTLASSGYRDTSRLAMSDPTMMLDIIQTTPGPLREMLAQARQALDEVDALLETGDEEALRAWMEQARQRR